MKMAILYLTIAGLVLVTLIVAIILTNLEGGTFPLSIILKSILLVFLGLWLFRKGMLKLQIARAEKEAGK